MARTKKDSAKTSEEGLTPEAIERSQPADPSEGYDFAVNVVKLNRAKAWVSQNAAALNNPEGDDLVEAVKQRYIATGGLTREVMDARIAKPKNNVVNMADDDGSKD